MHNSETLEVVGWFGRSIADCAIVKLWRVLFFQLLSFVILLLLYIHTYVKNMCFVWICQIHTAAAFKCHMFIVIIIRTSRWFLL